MIIIAAVSKLSAGKDTLVDYLRDTQGFHKLSTGDLVRELAEREGVDRTRGKLQDLATQIRRQRGEDYLSGLVIERIERNNWERVGLSGLRTPADVNTLKKRFGDALTLVRVEVQDPRVRFRRSIQRDNPRDVDSYTDFLRDDQREMELFDLGETLAMADLVIPNDGTLKHFYRQIEAKIIGPLLHGC